MTQLFVFGRSLGGPDGYAGGGRAGVYAGAPVKMGTGQIIIARGAKDEKLV